MDTHRAYCFNFLALTERWMRGRVAIAVAWVLSALGITLTVAAAWLIGEQLAIGAKPVDLEELSRIEVTAAFIAGVVNYMRFFGCLLNADVDGRRAELLTRGSGRPQFAVVALVGPAVVILIIVGRNFW
jgi:hypothetical protein